MCSGRLGRASNETCTGEFSDEEKGQIMRKIQILSLLCIVGAFSMVCVASASAAEWLLNGAAIATSDPVETVGEINFDVLVLGVLAVSLKCSHVVDGTVGPGSVGLVEKLLNLTKEEIGKELVGLALSCEVMTSAFEECGKAGSLAEVWRDNLPWETKLELEGETVLEDFPVTSGYHVLCANGKQNLCTGLEQERLTNESGGVVGVFEEASNEETCTTGVGHFGNTEAELTSPTEGGTLSVS